MVHRFINKNYIFYRLGSFRSFWKLRHRFGLLEFQRQKTGYGIQDKLSKTKDNISAVWEISLRSWLSVAIALAVAFALYMSGVHIDVIKQLPLMNYIASCVSLDRNIYIQMLVTIPSVIGIFIGLYFTAVSSVLSDAYKLINYEF